jgi:hypothetical protein
MDYRDYTRKWEKIFVGESFGNGYGGIYRDEEWIQKIIIPIVNSIKPHINNNPVFLADIGCGSGILGLNALNLLAGNAFLHSIDVNIRQLDGLKEEAGKLNVIRNYQAVNSNLFDIAYPDNFFSGIMGRLFLHHLTPDDNNRFWQFIVNKLKVEGVASIYAVVAPNESVASFIRTVYEWRAKKVGVEPQGFIPTHDYIIEKLATTKGINYKIFEEARGPLYVSGKASVQEKTGLNTGSMKGLEKIFQSASGNIRRACKIKKVSHAGSRAEVKTHEFFWPCQLVVIRKE